MWILAAFTGHANTGVCACKANILAGTIYLTAGGFLSTVTCFNHDESAWCWFFYTGAGTVSEQVPNTYRFGNWFDLCAGEGCQMSETSLHFLPHLIEDPVPG